MAAGRLRNIPSAVLLIYLFIYFMCFCFCSFVIKVHFILINDFFFNFSPFAATIMYQHFSLDDHCSSSIFIGWHWEYWVKYYSIHVPGWLQKWLNLITAPGSVSNEPGSVTWLATKYLKTVSWRNHTEKLTTCWAQNISFWLKINIPSSYFTILMRNCLENTLKLQFDSSVTAVRFLT